MSLDGIVLDSKQNDQEISTQFAFYFIILFYVPMIMCNREDCSNALYPNIETKSDQGNMVYLESACSNRCLCTTRQWG